MEPFSRVRRAFKRRLNLFSNFENRSYVSQKGMDFDRRLLGIRFKHSLYLEGYWQSENYFKDFESIIRDDLLIKPPVDSVNSRMAERIKKSTAVALHVRLFDNPQSGAINNASGDYYARAVAAIERRLPDAHYFIFSDQPEAARAIVPLPDARLTLVSHNQGDDNAYADLWLMTQCQHFIIANSTFSWWGAWLAAHPTKIVIAPGFESSDGVMSWGFEGLLPMEWIKL